MHRADAEVSSRVHRTRLRQGHGLGHQLTGPVTFTAAATADSSTCGTGDFAGHGIHLGRRAEMTRRGDPVKMTGVQWYEAAGSIQDVDGHGAARFSMADRCRKHTRQPDLRGQTQQPGGMSKAGRGALRPAVAHHLDDHTTSRQQVDPPTQQHACPVGTPCLQGLAHVRARPEQDQQCQRSGPRVDGMLGDNLCAADRSAAFTTQMGLGHQAAQPAPADARLHPGALPARQHRDPRESGIDLCSTPCWVGATWLKPLALLKPLISLKPLTCNGIGSPLPHSQVHTKHRSNAGLVAGLDETHRAIEAVTVGQGERWLTQRRGTFHQRRRGRCAVTQREAGRDVQVGKGITHEVLVTAMNSGNGRLMGSPSAP